MKTEEIALSRLVENEDNPRQIKASQFQKLVQSILVFPRMLTLRPIVVDATYKALGGNMRLKALRHIVTMDDVSIGLKFKAEGERLTDEMREALLAYWHDWQQQPTVTVVMADDLTEAQKTEFIAKDNIGYGSWDYDQLANKWDAKMLQGWGMAVWGDQSLQANPQVPDGKSKCGESAGSADAGTDDVEGAENLPPELDGVDMEPEPLEDFEGDEQTPMQNIVIKYRREDAKAVARLLGVTELDKIIYRFEDLPNREGGDNGEE